jgi:hypothetical protein
MLTLSINILLSLKVSELFLYSFYFLPCSPSFFFFFCNRIQILEYYIFFFFGRAFKT